MFSFFGRLAFKYKYFILAGWVIVTAVFFITAPSLSKVGITDQSQFLPSKSESARVRNILETKFPAYASTSSSTALIVVNDENGFTPQDMARAQSFHDWLVSSSAPKVLNSVVSVFDNAALQSTLVSADNTTMMMYVGFSTTALDDATKQAVKDIRAQFASRSGTNFYLTGNVGFLQDLFESVQKTIDRTTLVTVVLVIILLLIVYRSPIAAFVPLLAIGFSFLISRGLIGFLAQAGVGISTVTDAFLVVTIFGVGTDYCLFIMSRFREVLAEGADQSAKIEFTMKRIGPIIFASAVTVVIAFLCLTISRLGMTRTSGWALAIGITITLIAGLTLVPALMSIFGRYLFWPAMKPRVPSSKPKRWGWARTGEWIAKHPLYTAVPIIILLVLPYIAMPKFTLSANILTQLPKKAEATSGLNAIRAHFPMGELSPLELVIQSKTGDSLLTADKLTQIESLARSLGGVKQLSGVDSFSSPARQLATTSVQVRTLGDGITPAFDPTTLSSLTPLSGQLQTLALQYSGITTSTNFNTAAADLKQVSVLTAQLGTTAPADYPALVGSLQTAVYGVGDSLMGLAREFELTGSSPFASWLKAAYFSTDGTVVRIDLILATDPYSDAAGKEIPQIRQEVAKAVDSSGLTDVNHYVGGDAALQADMLKTSQDDFFLVLIVTSIGILAVIVILLRSVLAPLYMVGTVLFNYGASLGITSWILQDIFGFQNLINMLPVLVFVMLAAVGADYNIFLVSRIREEAETRHIKEAVGQAVGHTGNVITSCGIILAGTFATLMASSFPMVLEIGTAIAIGVLVDTFLVRALLVPSLAVLFGRWSWWPSPLFRKESKK